jgi:23S rRNA pseudouridine2605 synthase
MKERLQKLIAQAGVCSRRAAEKLLTEGRVCVNDEIAQLGESADWESDRITVDGNPIQPPQKQVYLMLHKPSGYVTTLSDEQGRATAAELVADCGVRVFPVGRLDRESEGLLLFTNDGALMQALTHPKGEINKTYEVTVRGELNGALARLRALREIEGEAIRPAQVRLLERTGGSERIEIIIHEGKNRQIRRMCKAASLVVMRLCRVAESCVVLGDLPSGQWRYLTEEEIEKLREEG